MSVGGARIFITGSTGFIGEHLVRRIRSSGVDVVAFVRSVCKARNMFRDDAVELRQGNLEDAHSMVRAMEGCDEVYHLAGFAKQWHRDPSTFYDVNVSGFRNVLDSALQCGVRRVVFTSTAGAIGPSTGKAVSESTPRKIAPTTLYEQSKAEAEELIPEYLDKGLDIVTVNPTRVFGPGQLNESNTVTLLIRDYVKGKWRYLPGDGKGVGNYVYVEDVVDGHLRGMQKGVQGERYILGGANLNYRELFEVISEVSGVSQKMIKVPLPVMMALARVEKLRADVTGRAPLITPGFVKKYTFDWYTDHSKAAVELGYSPTDMYDAVDKTLTWLRGQGS